VLLRALFVAPPAAGKGTQGPRLAARHGVPYVATGDMLRSQVAQGTDLGRAAESYMLDGGLVPDELVVAMVRGRIAEPVPEPGFVLDGFPRTLAQATAAHGWAQENGRTFHTVVSLVVPREQLISRVQHRREEDASRADDALETFLHRLDVFDAETQPLLDFYRERGILLEVDGLGTVDEVAARIDAVVDPIDTSDPADT